MFRVAALFSQAKEKHAIGKQLFSEYILFVGAYETTITLAAGKSYAIKILEYFYAQVAANFRGITKLDNGKTIIILTGLR